MIMEPKTTTSTVKPINQRKLGLALIFLMTFICLIDRANYGVSTSSMMKALNLSIVEMGMATTAFSLAYAVMQIPGSLIVRRYGTMRSEDNEADNIP